MREILDGLEKLMTSEKDLVVSCGRGEDEEGRGRGQLEFERFERLQSQLLFEQKSEIRT